MYYLKGGVYEQRVGSATGSDGGDVKGTPPGYEKGSPPGYETPAFQVRPCQP